MTQFKDAIFFAMDELNLSIKEVAAAFDVPPETARGARDKMNHSGLAWNKLTSAAKHRKMPRELVKYLAMQILVPYGFKVVEQEVTESQRANIATSVEQARAALDAVSQAAKSAQ